MLTVFATRTVEIKVADGFTDTYEIKTPTDKELSTYVNGTWNRGTAEYDSTSPKSINYFLSNYVETNPLATWTSSYLNLVPFRAVFINCQELTDFNRQEGHHRPTTGRCHFRHFRSSVCRLHWCLWQILKRLHFRITDEKSNIPVQFSLIFEHPSFLFFQHFR